jgi:hypothetical protein
LKKQNHSKCSLNEEIKERWKKLTEEGNGRYSEERWETFVVMKRVIKDKIVIWSM